MIPLLLEMIRWGARYNESTAVPRVIIQRLNKDINAMATEARQQIRQARQAFLQTLPD